MIHLIHLKFTHIFRSFKDVDEVTRHIEQLVGLGVDRVLLIGGDAREAAGHFWSSFQLLESGALTVL